CVVEGFSRRLAKSRVLVGNSCLVQLRLHGEDRILGRFKHGVEPTNDSHRQDDVPVFAANIDIAQNIIGDVPDKVADVQVAHWGPLTPWSVQLFSANRSSYRGPIS